jgi:hypothetical protein
MAPAWLHWRWGLTFCLGQAGLRSSCSKFPAVAGVTGELHHAQLFPIEMGSRELFFAQADLEL